MSFKDSLCLVSDLTVSNWWALNTLLLNELLKAGLEQKF